jgi:RNA polymerase sigma-70 factor (ECF subfamily)
MSSAHTYWHSNQQELLRETNLNSVSVGRKQMDGFLADVERRAFVIARRSLGNDADALDAVQDAMIKLVRKYASRPKEEWRPLFYRILKNRIVDLQRKSYVRKRFMAWLPATGDDVADYADPVAAAPAHAGEEPDRQAMVGETFAALQTAVLGLPARQQQAFLLRVAEGMDVAETALTMECSQGSVKTHYSRAVHSLRETLGDYWR